MYLTKEEFLVLSARKMGINQKSEIAQRFNLSETTVAYCDMALFKKYGIKTADVVEAKQRLIDAADLNKVQIADINQMPYYQYEPVEGFEGIYNLVRKITITKKDVLKLLDFFNGVNDENKEYELVLGEDYPEYKAYRYLKIDNFKNEFKNIQNAKTVIMGIGGGGQNIANYIFDKEGNNYKIFSINSDEMVLRQSRTMNILLSENKHNSFFSKLFKSKKYNLGCGADINLARDYAFAHEKEIKKALKGVDNLLLISCFGGGIGTGATPVIAKFARDMKIKTKAIIIRPFNFEGEKRRIRTQEGISELKKYTDCICEVQNEELVKSTDNVISFKNAFEQGNETIYKMALNILKD